LNTEEEQVGKEGNLHNRPAKRKQEVIIENVRVTSINKPQKTILSAAAHLSG
jgi:hypothetical protein